MSVYIFRATMQSLIRFGYAAAGCIAILVFAETPVSLTGLWSFVGLALIVVITPPLMIVLGTLGAFVPDIQFVISNLMRVGMFLTPIFWHSTTGVRGHLSMMNPLTHFINIVRTPVVEGSVPLHSFAICSAIVVGLWILAVFLLGKYHKKIVFWIS